MLHCLICLCNHHESWSQCFVKQSWWLLGQVLKVCQTVLVISRPGSESAMILSWVFQGHHGPLFNIIGKTFGEIANRAHFKTPRKPASENVVCLCCLLNILANFSNLFLHAGKQCGLGAVWSWSTLFAKMTFKITSRWQSRRQLL